MKLAAGAETRIRTRARGAGVLLKKVRSELEPKLLAAGYRLAGRNSRAAKHRLFIDYSRREDVLTFSWDWHQKSLTVELLTAEESELRVIATTELSGALSTSDIDARLAPLIASAGSFLDELPEHSPKPKA